MQAEVTSVRACPVVALDGDRGPSLVAGQQLGGSSLWLLRDVTTLAFLVGVIVQRAYSDARGARRVDRQLDRIHGDAATVALWWQTPSQDDGRPAR